jgi:hypothetical protein|nr:MAG TPA: hypothetical protein [Caudoviricetes sp.]
MTTKYIAYDGKEFDNPSNCKKYERYSLKANAGDAFKSIKLKLMISTQKRGDTE